jgi:hypothetical protein
MMGFGKRRDREALCQLLAGYADGELDQATRARVEAWLTESPAAREALTAQRRFSRHNRPLWRAAAAPAVSEGSWDRLLGRVQAALDAPTPAASPIQRRRWKYLVPAVSTAAAAAVALFLARAGNGPMPTPPAGPVTLEEAFAVATPADVDILSLDGGDTGLIVVGVPPLPGTIVLASVDDVKLRQVRKDPTDGMMPKVQMNDTAVAPMIVAPVGPIAGR